MNKLAKLVTSNSFQYEELAATTIPNKFEYADRHELKLISRIHSGKEHWAYEIFMFIREELMLLPQGDYLAYFDCDSLITNMNVDLNDRLQSTNYPDCLVGQEEMVHPNHRRSNQVICCAQTIIKNSLASLTWLDKIIYSPSRLNFADSEDREYENRHLLDLLITPQRFMNSYPLPLDFILNPDDSTWKWQKGDFICHAMRHPLDRKIELMKSHLLHVQR